MTHHGRTVFLAAAMLSAAAAAQAQNNRISSCQTITEPGAYTLARNIVADPKTLITDSTTGRTSCLNITADYVNIDLAGFAVIGDATPNTVGISSGDQKGIVLRNGTVTGFSLSGITLTGSYHTVESVRAIGNGRNGINLFGDPFRERGGIVRDSIASENGGNGISITQQGGGLVDGNVALHNGGYGIVVTCPTVVVNNMAASNAVAQIRLSPFSDPSGTPTPCTANNNSPQ